MNAARTVFQASVPDGDMHPIKIRESQRICARSRFSAFERLRGKHFLIRSESLGRRRAGCRDVAARYQEPTSLAKDEKTKLCINLN
jgi:hypothetical protein